MSETQCEDCKGSGKLMAFVDGRNPKTGKRFGGVSQIRCITCDGSGKISVAKALLIAQGKQLREARVAKRQSLSEAAHEQGISPAELSARERGKAA